MNARQINTTLYLSAAACAAAAVASLLLAFAWPLAKPASDLAVDHPAPTTKASGKNDLPPLSAFEPIWSIKLRQDLGPAAPASVSAAPMPVPPPVQANASVPVTLVGTIGTSLAMLRTPANIVEVRGVGESIDGVEVVAVRPAEVDVTFNGRKITLTKPPEPEQ